MGTVYLAERDEPGLRKTVAVNVLNGESRYLWMLLAQDTRASRTEACASLRSVQEYWGGLRAQGQLPGPEAEDLERIPPLIAVCPS